MTPTADTNEPGSCWTAADAQSNASPSRDSVGQPGCALQASARHAPLPPERRTGALEYCGMLTSTLVASAVGAAAGSVVTGVLQNCRSLWVSLRKARRRLTSRIGR